MAYDIVVPRLGWSMDEGLFQGWLKRDGEWVSVGDLLFVLEGDKAVQEIESFDSGFLRILPAAPEVGDEVQIGQLLGYLCAEDEPPPFGKEAAATNSKDTSSIEKDPARPQTHAARESSVEPATRIRITPRARRLAQQLGIDWTKLTGTGKNGRIRARDVTDG